MAAQGIVDRQRANTVELDLPRGVERVVGGRYELVDKLGEGGFAVVYKARHTELRDLFYALKILRGEHAGQAEVIKKFRHEAVLLSSLRCPQTVRVVDFGVTGGAPYFVMEFVTGVSLETLLSRHGKLPAGMVARLSMDILESLAEAHTARIVHRDIKPANVLVVEGFGGGPARGKVLDFGIAKVLANEDDASAAANQTVGDFIFCTPLYAPPEVLRRQAQPQSDLYSLAHMMAEALDGRAPYAAEVPVMSAHQHLQGNPVPLGPEADGSPLAPIIRRAAEAKIEDRYPTAAAMLADLRKVLPLLADEPEPQLFVPRPPTAASPSLADSDTLVQDSSPSVSMPQGRATTDSATRLGWEQPSSSTPVGLAQPRGPASTPAVVGAATRTVESATTSNLVVDDTDEEVAYEQPAAKRTGIIVGAAAGIAVASIVGWFALSGDPPASVAPPAPAPAAGSSDTPVAPPASPPPASVVQAVAPVTPEGSAKVEATPTPPPEAMPPAQSAPKPRQRKSSTTPKEATAPTPKPTSVVVPPPPPPPPPPAVTEPKPEEPKRTIKTRKPLFVPE